MNGFLWFSASSYAKSLGQLGLSARFGDWRSLLWPQRRRGNDELCPVSKGIGSFGLMEPQFPPVLHIAAHVWSEHPTAIGYIHAVRPGVKLKRPIKKLSRQRGLQPVRWPKPKDGEKMMVTSGTY